VIVFAGGLLDPDRWRVLENCVCFHAVPSSNALARDLIELYFEEGQGIRATVLAAEAQPGAYGRNERRWEAPAGQGLYLTLLRRAEAGEPLSIVPIAVARWAREVLVAETGAAIELKWPNDLYVGKRKLAGVIAESRTQGDDTYVAIGIGINVKGASSGLGVANATTLEQETGKSLAIAPLLQALLDRFDRELAAPRWDDEVRAWELVATHHPGDRLTVRRNGGEITGAYVGLDTSGFLRLETDAGEATVASGELASW
jgi:BirA family biotin operon repressor/biotin-[acetyl-CoA-carboxylase] ligase